jgi:hypothetical protein
MTSPAYDLAIPAAHVRTIARLAGLPAQEERAFFDAYLAAHPERAAEVLGAPQQDGSGRILTITLPQLITEAAQQRLETLILRFAREVAAAMQQTEADAVNAAPNSAP